MGFSAAALFLLMVLAVSGMSASNTVDGIDSNYAAPVNPVYEPITEPERQAPDSNYVAPEEPVCEPINEPELKAQEDLLPESEESEQSPSTEEVQPDISQEDEDPESPDIAYPEKTQGKGKSNAHGKGFLRNLLRNGI